MPSLSVSPEHREALDETDAEIRQASADPWWPYRDPQEQPRRRSECGRTRSPWGETAFT